MIPLHGGNIREEAIRLGCRPEQLLDASASLVPFSFPRILEKSLKNTLTNGVLREYPDLTQQSLKVALAEWHGVDSSMVLPGNGAAELFTWVAREAASYGLNALPVPCFSDYQRALKCWGGHYCFIPLPLTWKSAMPHSFPLASHGDVLWITNPHNPTGQLWSRSSLERMLSQYQLVICDEAFLPLVPNGESQSMASLVASNANLVVIRSLTKLFAIAGLRLGYAISQPERLCRWSAWRDPWSVNGLALFVGTKLLEDKVFMENWLARVHAWIAKEGPWFETQLARFKDLRPYPSSVNFLLVKGNQSLLPLREQLAQKRILVRDCRSFAQLGDKWLRIGLQERRANRLIVNTIRGLIS